MKKGCFQSLVSVAQSDRYGRTAALLITDEPAKAWIRCNTGFNWPQPHRYKTAVEKPHPADASTTAWAIAPDLIDDRVALVCIWPKILTPLPKTTGCRPGFNNG